MNLRHNVSAMVTMLMVTAGMLTMPAAQARPYPNECNRAACLYEHTWYEGEQEVHWNGFTYRNVRLHDRVSSWANKGGAPFASLGDYNAQGLKHRVSGLGDGSVAPDLHHFGEGDRADFLVNYRLISEY